MMTRWPAATAVQALSPPSGGGPGLKLDLLVVRLMTRSARPKMPLLRPPRPSSAPSSWLPPSSKSLSSSLTPGMACVLESRVATCRSPAACFSEPPCGSSSASACPSSTSAESLPFSSGLVDGSWSVLLLLVDWEPVILGSSRSREVHLVMLSHGQVLARLANAVEKDSFKEGVSKNTLPKSHPWWCTAGSDATKHGIKLKKNAYANADSVLSQKSARIVCH